MDAPLPLWRPSTPSVARRSAMLAMLLLATGLLAPVAHACLCSDRRLPEDARLQAAVDRARFVVLARVTAMERSAPDATGRFDLRGTVEVVEGFKGDAPATLPIADEQGVPEYSSSCGEGLPALAVGDVVLLFLDDPIVDEMAFEDCSRSRVIAAPGTDAELARLRDLPARVPSPSIETDA